MSLYSLLTPKERFRVEAEVSRSAKNAGRAYLLALLLGAFGAHRIYLGRYATGGFMLLGGVGTVGSWFFGGFSMGAIPGLELWAIIDMLFIQKMLDRQQGELRAKVIERVLGDRGPGGEGDDGVPEIPLRPVRRAPVRPKLEIRGGGRILKEET